MRELVRATSKTCQKCKWSMGFGSQPGNCQTEVTANNNIACDYLNKAKHSRIFEDGKLAYDPRYCDKFERGPRKRYMVTPRLTKEWPLGFNPYQE